MKKEILINATSSEIRVGITEDRRLAELFLELPDRDRHVGSIYLGRVEKVIQGMNAAFVDIGLEQHAFLHFSDAGNAGEDFSDLLTDDDDDDEEQNSKGSSSKKKSSRSSRGSSKGPGKGSSGKESSRKSSKKSSGSSKSDDSDDSKDEQKGNSGKDRSSKSSKSSRSKGRGSSKKSDQKEESKEKGSEETSDSRDEKQEKKSSRRGSSRRSGRGRGGSSKSDGGKQEEQKERENDTSSDESGSDDREKSDGNSSKSGNRGSSRRSGRRGSSNRGEKDDNRGNRSDGNRGKIKRESRPNADDDNRGNRIEPVEEKQGVDGNRVDVDPSGGDGNRSRNSSRNSRGRGSGRGGGGKGDGNRDGNSSERNRGNRRGAAEKQKNSDERGESKSSRKEENSAKDSSEGSSKSSKKKSSSRRSSSRRRGSSSKKSESKEQGNNQKSSAAEKSGGDNGGGSKGKRSASTSDSGNQPDGGSGKSSKKSTKKSTRKSSSRKGSSKKSGGAKDGDGGAPPPAVIDAKLPTFQTRRHGEVTIALERGQDVLVQVTRESYASKGVKVSTKISLPGRFIVLMPLDPTIGISRKVLDVKERRRLRGIARKILPKGFGCIIRTVAQDKETSMLEEELRMLLERWREIEEKLKDAKPPKHLYTEVSVANSVMRDLFTEDISKVTIDNKALHEEIHDYVTWAAPKLANKIEYYGGREPIFQKFGLDKDLDRMIASKVWLNSGGYIIIEQTEAMMVIDVNSGRYAKEKEQELNALRINLESAREIARQIRLRDIGGLLVIDFIDLYEEKNRKKVYDEMKKEMARDRAKSVVLPMTQFGIVQMTRQRVRQQLVQTMSEQCPTCNGKGIVPSKGTVLRKIERWLTAFRADTKEFRLTLNANPDLVEFLTEGDSMSRLTKLMLKHFVRVKVIPDESLTMDEFRFTSNRRGLDITDRYLEKS